MNVASTRLSTRHARVRAPQSSKNILALVSLLTALHAQTDSSGNAMLKGKYQFREVAVMNVDSAGTLTETAAAFGTITFDGAGRYTVAGTYQDNIISNGAPQTLALYGNYSVSASGVGNLADPLNPADPSGLIYGAVGQQVFVGSSTEGRINNLFVAIPAGAAALNETYSVGMIDFSAKKNSLFQLTANATPTRTMVASADGNFAIGWTPGGYDVVFGIKAMNGSDATFHGTYYLAGLENIPRAGDSCGSVDSFYGSLIADGAGNQILHQRLASPLCYVVDFESDDHIHADGTQYVLGAGGAAFLGIGSGNGLSLTIGVRANAGSSSGMHLNPAGIANAASFAPPTMSIAPGEMITLYGGGFSASTQVMPGAAAFPTSIDGVQVLINGTAAQIYYASPSQISAIVPFSVRSAGSNVASIQVVNGSAKTNTVTAFVNSTAPGIFTQSANGLGYVSAVHTATGALVTPDNPAVAGEYLAVFLTGLGTVTSSGDADVYVGNHLSVYFDDYARGASQKAVVSFAGLAPGLAGLYQMNVQVPSGVGPGDVYLEISTDSADVNQAMIPVSGGDKFDNIAK
jgi:uncharacterized protein (TIGR03437 family)